jgi:hypothetical protein
MPRAGAGVLPPPPGPFGHVDYPAEPHGRHAPLHADHLEVFEGPAGARLTSSTPGSRPRPHSTPGSDPRSEVSPSTQPSAVTQASAPPSPATRPGLPGPTRTPSIRSPPCSVAPQSPPACQAASGTARRAVETQPRREAPPRPCAGEGHRPAHAHRRRLPPGRRKADPPGSATPPDSPPPLIQQYSAVL